MESTPLVQQLLNKSQEAFLMAIEIYNKPSIRYRVEGFSFFICNAWELMLKARIINTQGIDAIYYKDNPSRTKTLENCIKMIFTYGYSMLAIDFIVAEIEKDPSNIIDNLKRKVKK